MISAKLNRAIEQNISSKEVINEIYSSLTLR